jgi:hypothetical protein
MLAARGRRSNRPMLIRTDGEPFGDAGLPVFGSSTWKKKPDVERMIDDVPFVIDQSCVEQSHFNHVFKRVVGASPRACSTRQGGPKAREVEARRG